MDTFTKVVTLLGNELGVDPATITPDSDIIRDLGADSLDVVQMLMALEDEFGITVSEDEASNLKTVRDIVNLIEK